MKNENQTKNNNFVNTLSQTLGSDVFILDNQKNILNTSDDKLLEKDLLDCIQENDKRLYRNSTLEQFSLCMNDFEYVELIVPICDYEQAILGYLILKNNTSVKYNEDLIDAFVPAVEKFLLNSIAGGKRENNSLDFALVEIMKGNFTDSELIKRKMKDAGFLFKKNMRFLFIELGEKQKTREGKRLLENIKTIWNIAYAYTFQDNIVILICSDEEIFPENKLQSLKKLLFENQVFAGFSEEFHSIDKYLGYYLNRAVCAGKAAYRLNDKNRFSVYEDVVSTAILFSEQMPYGIRKCCDPRFLKIMENDQQNNTEYLKTLLVFWNFDADRELSSEYLGIHRNTLGYRLRYVEEQIGKSVYSPSLIISFNSTVEILKILDEMEIDCDFNKK